ncbi:MAG TPA: hypothetical protein VGC53_20540 [Vicinamibacteria bacterium]
MSFETPFGVVSVPRHCFKSPCQTDRDIFAGNFALGALLGCVFGAVAYEV